MCHVVGLHNILIGRILVGSFVIGKKNPRGFEIKETLRGHKLMVKSDQYIICDN